MYRKKKLCQSFYGNYHLALRTFQAIVYEKIMKFPVQKLPSYFLLELKHERFEHRFT